MKRTAALVLLLYLLPLGCTTVDTARSGFNGTVQVLANLREQGTFTKAEAETVTLLIHAGEQTLDRWQAAVLLGQPTYDLMREYNLVLRELVAAQIAAERRAQLCTEGGATCPIP